MRRLQWAVRSYRWGSLASEPGYRYYDTTTGSPKQATVVVKTPRPVVITHTHRRMVPGHLQPLSPWLSVYSFCSDVSTLLRKWCEPNEARNSPQESPMSQTTSSSRVGIASEECRKTDADAGERFEEWPRLWKFRKWEARLTPWRWEGYNVGRDKQVVS